MVVEASPGKVDLARRQRSSLHAQSPGQAALARRLDTVLATVGSRPAWVFGEASPPVPLSPAAVANKERAARVPDGIKAKLLEQQARARAKLGSRLELLASACEGTLEKHSPGRPGDQLRTAAEPSAVTREAARAAPISPSGERIPDRKGAMGSSRALASTPRNPATPPTVSRRMPLATPGRMQPADSARAASRPVSSPGGTLGSPAGSESSSARLTGAGAGPEPATQLQGQPGARRRLSFTGGASGSGTAVEHASAGQVPYMPGTPRSAAAREWAQMQAAPASTAPSTTELFGGTTAAPWRSAEPTRPGLPSTAAAQGRPVASATSSGDAGASQRSPHDEPLLDEAPGAKAGSRLAWQEPATLGSYRSLLRLAGGGLGRPDQDGDGSGLYKRSTSLLGHRERLRAGLADLHAELHTSWRHLMEGGLV